jgi:hypothetical protein
VTVRTVLVVDDEGELAATLSLLEEVLLRLQPYDADDEPAAADLGPAELEALQRVSLAVHHIDWGHAADFYGAGGFNFGKVHALQLDSDDLAATGRAIAALGALLLPGGDEYTREALDDFRRGAAPVPHWRGHDQSSAELVSEFAQAHGLLDLAPDADVEEVAAQAGQAGRVDLEAGPEAAFRRYLERVMAMKLNDPLQRFLHLG